MTLILLYRKYNLIAKGIIVLIMLLAAVPEQASGQLLEDRGKLKTAKRSKQLTGKNRKVNSTMQNPQSKSSTPIIKKLTDPDGGNRYTISDNAKKSNSKYQPFTSEFQGQNKGNNRRGQAFDDKMKAMKTSKRVVAIKSPDGIDSGEGKFQGFDIGRTKNGNKIYYKEASRHHSSKIIEVSPSSTGKDKYVSYQGFDVGLSRQMKKFMQQEISRQNSGKIIEVPQPDIGKEKYVSYKGFDRGRSKYANKIFYKEISKHHSGYIVEVPKPSFGPDKNVTYKGFDVRPSKLATKQLKKEISRQNSGIIIAVTPTKMEHNKTHKHKGFDRGFTKLGYALYHLDNSRAQSKFEGEVQVKRYVDRLKDFDKAAEKMANYTGGFKTRKRNNKMHPSASYVYGKRAKSYEQKELWRQMNVQWVRMNKNKGQPDSVKNGPSKLKFDKKEKDIWNY